MPCYQSNNAPSGYGKIGTGGYATEAECLQACKEGACCNGTTCSVKPQCQCNAAAGEVFRGVGTDCDPNPCVGACCLPGEVCQITSLEGCAALGGRFQGYATNCEPNPCVCLSPLGRCCGPGTAIYPIPGAPLTYIPCTPSVTESQCEEIGGVWTGCEQCDSFPPVVDLIIGAVSACNPLP